MPKTRKVIANIIEEENKKENKVTEDKLKQDIEIIIGGTKFMSYDDTINESLKQEINTDKNDNTSSEIITDTNKYDEKDILPINLTINNKKYVTYQSIIDDKNKIQCIDLSCESLVKIPKKLCVVLTMLEKLTELKLNKNYLNKLPKKILQCKNLKILDLSSNLFCAEGFDGISKLVNLEELNLSNCGDISEEICSLVNLKKLILSYNSKFSFEGRIETLLSPNVKLSHRQGISDVYRNVGSKIFSLDSAKIFTLPKNINKLVNLEHLDISNCELKIIPEDICLLTNLTYLDMSNNKNKKIPDKIGNLEKLTFLNIENNYLEKIPESIGKLQNLKLFKFLNMIMTTLPSGIWDVPCITTLNTTFSLNEYGNKQYFKITKLPAKYNDSDVKIIINSDTNIPDKIKNVTVYCNIGNPTIFNNIPFDVEELTIHAKIPIKLLNLPSTLKKLTLVSSNGYEWIKNYIKTGEIKIPFGCEFNYA